ncbi:MAG: DUF6268 family outer membrane beta-barrel protein [Bacteroidota bacterium]
MKTPLTLISFFTIYLLFAQDAEEAIPYRTKIAEFSSETIMDYRTSTSSEQFGGAINEIERDRLYKAKLGIPLVIKKDKIFGLQLKYYQQKFLLDFEENPTDYDLYVHLNSKTFTNAGIRTFYKQNLKDGSELKLVAGAELKSDQFQWNKNSSKYFVSAVQTWKKSEATEMGGGLYLNWTMGLATAYPLFLLKHDLSPRWTLDLMLPKQANMRYRINNHNFLIARAQLTGWRYNLTNALQSTQGDLTLRKSDLQLSLSWEKEIHDWLWFGIDVGYNKNIQYFLVNPGERSRYSLIDINPRDAIFTKFSIFMVPPKKFYK